jgi:hypothetical protein
MSAFLAVVDDSVALVVQLVSMLVFGIACAVVAAGRGRSSVGWFFIGLLFGCFALIVLLVLPNPKLEQDRHQRLAQENRRLREQLKKDRQVADERHGGIARRLDVHDQALGIDTSGAARLGDGGAPPELPRPAEEPVWYYAIGNERFGPVTAAAIRGLRAERKLDASTLVWCAGMDNWQNLASIKDLGEQTSA